MGDAPLDGSDGPAALETVLHGGLRSFGVAFGAVNTVVLGLSWLLSLSLELLTSIACEVATNSRTRSSHDIFQHLVSNLVNIERENNRLVYLPRIDAIQLISRCQLLYCSAVSTSTTPFSARTELAQSRYA